MVYNFTWKMSRNMIYALNLQGLRVPNLGEQRIPFSLLTLYNNTH
jgi:hypothetical protein